VQRAAAVRRCGLAFVHAVNAGRFPLDLARGFAYGGLMPTPPRMAFASGGLVPSTAGVNGRRPINLHIGGEVFTDLLVPDEVVEKMVRAARGRRVRAAGKKPVWY
jgi:hypothetical protein